MKKISLLSIIICFFYIFVLGDVFSVKINYIPFDEYKFKWDNMQEDDIKSNHSVFFVNCESEKSYYKNIINFNQNIKRYYILHPNKFKEGQFNAEMETIWTEIVKKKDFFLNWPESDLYKIRWYNLILQNKINTAIQLEKDYHKKYNSYLFIGSYSINDKLLFIYLMDSVDKYPEKISAYDEFLEKYHKKYIESFNGNSPAKYRFGNPIGYGYAINIHDYLLYLIIGNEQEYLAELFDNEIEYKSSLFPNKEQAILIKNYVMKMDIWFKKDGFKEFLIKRLDEVIESKESCDKLAPNYRECYKGDATEPYEVFDESSVISD